MVFFYVSPLGITLIEHAADDSPLLLTVTTLYCPMSSAVVDFMPNLKFVFLSLVNRYLALFSSIGFPSFCHVTAKFYLKN